jgi:hypothetical protein
MRLVINTCIAISALFIYGCEENLLRQTQSDSQSGTTSGDSEGIYRADKVAKDITKNEYVGMWNYGPADERIVYRKKYIQQILRLNDKKLTAYFAKDCLNSSILEYSSMLERKTDWYGKPITPEQTIEFQNNLNILKPELDLLNKYYPSGNEIFKEMETDQW